VQKCCKLPTSLSLSTVYESRFCGFRRTNIRRLFSAKLEPAQRELELIKTTCSSSVRIFYSTGDPIILATKPYLTDDVRERVGKMCFLLCTLSDNEFFSTAADSRYIIAAQQKVAHARKEIEMETESCSGCGIRFSLLELVKKRDAQ
jgi:hypothetical protein